MSHPPATPKAHPQPRPRRLSLHIAAVAALALTCVVLAQSYLFPLARPHLPDLVSSPPNSVAMPGKRAVGYFVNWGIYGRKFPPQQIPSEHLTHLNYAFANVDKESGEVVLSDSWADVEGDSWNDEGTNLYGCFKAIYLIKKKHRNLKVLLSIGGWTYSPNFERIADPAWRGRFVASAVRLVEDIDYEYPKTPSDAAAYVDLLHELRHALFQLARSKGRRDGQYQLTVAAPCGADNMRVLRVAEMDAVLDFWNLMAYDFAGSWDQVAGHQAALYAPPHLPSIANAVTHYTSAGVHPSKLVIGLPLYGRAFANTAGLGHAFSGVGEGSWEAGMWDYKALPLPGSVEHYDAHAGASWSYDPHTCLFVSYDTPQVAAQKADYINSNGLGGAMFWELDADKPEESGQNMVHTVRAAFERGGGGLERTENELAYPGSKYDNLRAGM